MAPLVVSRARSALARATAATYAAWSSVPEGKARWAKNQSLGYSSPSSEFGAPGGRSGKLAISAPARATSARACGKSRRGECGVGVPGCKDDDPQPARILSAG